MLETLTVGELKKFLEDKDDDLPIYFKDDETDWIKEAQKVGIAKIEALDQFDFEEQIIVITGFYDDEF